MGLTLEERHYDYMVTGGRWYAESRVVEFGLTVGIVKDYLTGNPETDYFFFESDWFSEKDMYELYLRSVAEGYKFQRFEHTAEEIMIWAHEVDVETFGLKGIFHRVVREPLTPMPTDARLES